MFICESLLLGGDFVQLRGLLDSFECLMVFIQVRR